MPSQEYFNQKIAEAEAAGQLAQAEFYKAWAVGMRPQKGGWITREESFARHHAHQKAMGYTSEREAALLENTTGSADNQDIAIVAKEANGGYMRSSSYSTTPPTTDYRTTPITKEPTTPTMTTPQGVGLAYSSIGYQNPSTMAQFLSYALIFLGG